MAVIGMTDPLLSDVGINDGSPLPATMPNTEQCECATTGPTRVNSEVSPANGPADPNLDTTVAKIKNEKIKGRYVAYNAAGTEMGWLGYRKNKGVLVIWTTRTEPEFRGRGVADALTRHVMEHAVAKNTPVAPECWYASEWIQKNPKFARYVTDPGF